MARRTDASSRRRTADALSVETQFDKLQSQLERLQLQVRQAQQVEVMGQATATIAHEVSGLLTPILGYAKKALADDDVALMRKALARTVTNAEMLVAMSNRLLGLTSAKPTQRQPTPLRPIVDEALASLCRDLSKDGIGIRIEIPDGLAAQVDALQLQQVLFNLFLNAREAMSAAHSGRLVINAESTGRETVLRIRNSGPPIPSDVLPHVFEPFQSTKPAERNGRAKCGGLGLALCRDLVHENDGTISVESELESGTTFTITLPSASTGDADPLASTV